MTSQDYEEMNGILITHTNNKYELTFDGVEVKCRKNNFMKLIDKILEENTDVKVLSIQGFDDFDFAQIRKLQFTQQIKRLHLCRINTTDLEFLSIFPNVEYFRLAYNMGSNPPALDLNGIGHLTQLKSLEIGEVWNPIENLSFIKKLEQIEAISIRRLCVANANDLYGLKHLKYLEVDECCPEFDYVIFEELPSLEALILSPQGKGVELSRIPSSLLAHLKYLNLSSNCISDIKRLEVAQKLEFLNLQGNRIEDITPISRLPLLRKLSITMNNVSDLTPLQDLENLEELFVGGNPISISHKEIFELLPSIQALDLRDVNGNYRDVYNFNAIESKYVKTKKF